MQTGRTCMSAGGPEAVVLRRGAMARIPVVIRSCVLQVARRELALEVAIAKLERYDLLILG